MFNEAEEEDFKVKFDRWRVSTKCVICVLLVLQQTKAKEKFN